MKFFNENIIEKYTKNKTDGIDWPKIFSRTRLLNCFVFGVNNFLDNETFQYFIGSMLDSFIK